MKTIVKNVHGRLDCTDISNTNSENSFLENLSIFTHIFGKKLDNLVVLQI